jgi:hypothetical protein
VRDVSEELRASFIRVKRIGELGTTLAITSNRHTLTGTFNNVHNMHEFMHASHNLRITHNFNNILMRIIEPFTKAGDVTIARSGKGHRNDNY